MKVTWKFWKWNVWILPSTGRIDWVAIFLLVGLPICAILVLLLFFFDGSRDERTSVVPPIADTNAIATVATNAVVVAAATQPQSGIEDKFGWLSIVIWSMVGLGIAALLIQNRKKIAARWTARRARTAAGSGGAPATVGAPTPSVWSIVAKWVFGVLGGLAIAYGLYLIPYAQVWGWLQRLPYGNIPLWGYTVGIPVAILIIAVLIAAMKDGKTGSEKLKKLAELFGAFAKLGLTLAVIAVLAIFIVGPKMFWKGDYTPPARHAVVAGGPPAPVGGAQATPAVLATPVAPQSRTITIPIGDLNAPFTQWSEEVQVVPGWSFRWDVVGQGGKIGVLVDGATRDINDPTRRTDTHATQSLRFISLEGRPMQIAVSYYR